MNSALRRYFDEQLEQILTGLPALVHQALDKIPLYVEDFPAKKLMLELQLDHREELQGLYLGHSPIEHGDDVSGTLSQAIFLFREGILAMSRNEEGNIDEAELREQIRVTLLHEVGHYYGLEEDDLENRGYG